MLLDPEAYFSFANMTPAHFPPSTAFWGWFGVSGLLFYGLYPFIYRRVPFYALGAAVFSLAGVVVTAYMLLAGPLTLEMGAIHLGGDVAGLIGFGAAAWLDYAARRKKRVEALYVEEGQGLEKGAWKDLLGEYETQAGGNLKELSDRKSTLIVFLRHFGCTFCRETLGDLKRQRADIESADIEIVLVHMVDDETASQYMWGYGLADVHRISDPSKRLYNAFELERGNFAQLFGLTMWVEGFRAGLLKGYGVGRRQIGDGFQMPGAFLLYKGRIRRSFRHQTAADRPDYCILGDCVA